MKKITFALILILIAVFVSACGGNSENVSPPEINDTNNETAVNNVTPEPTPEVSLVKVENFTATDLNGNNYDNTIFGGSKLTMVNIWATYCGPCISEMPDLGKISNDYSDDEFKIIGIVSDASDPRTESSAGDIVAETGADYIHLLPSRSIIEALMSNVMYVPTTYFVNSAGELVGEEYIGSRSESEWTEIIDGLLTEIG